MQVSSNQLVKELQSKLDVETFSLLKAYLHNVANNPKSQIQITGNGNIVGHGNQIVQVESEYLKRELLFFLSRKNMIPFQVPVDCLNFVGRTAKLEEMEDVLNSQIFKVIVLHGMGGVGKSTLAARFASIYRKRFNDGIVWVDLKTQDINSILDSIAEAYGIILHDLQSIRSRIFAIKSILQSKESLLIMDNAEGSSFIDDLLPLIGSCFTIITTRDEYLPASLKHILLRVDTFIEKEAIRLFEVMIGKNIIEDNISDAKNVVGECGLVPLALTIAASTIKEAHLTLTEYKQLLESNNRLEVLKYRNNSVKTVLETSWILLGNKSKTLFAYASVFGGTIFSISAVSAITKLDSIQTKIELGLLTSNSILQYIGNSRYKLHPLVKEFAIEKFNKLTENLRNKIRKRMISFYNTLVTQEEIYNISAAEYENILKAARDAYQVGHFTQVLVFADKTNPIFRLKGLNGYAEELLKLAINSASKCRKPHQQHVTMISLGEVQRTQGKYENAKKLFQQCTKFFATADDEEHVAIVNSELGELERVQGRIKKAREYHLMGLEHFQRTKNFKKEGLSLHDLGLVERILGNYTHAEQLFKQSINIRSTLDNQLEGDRWSNGYNLLELGIIALIRHNYIESKDILQQCEKEFENYNDKRGLAHVFQRLGEIAFFERDYKNSYEYHVKSQLLRSQIGDIRREAISLRDIAKAQVKMNDVEIAEQNYIKSLKISVEINAKLDTASTLIYYSELLIDKKNTIDAKKKLTEAIKLIDEIKNENPFIASRYLERANKLLETLSIEKE